MDNLFNTPTQGQRLIELIPDIKYHFAWNWHESSLVVKVTNDPKTGSLWHTKPALTLQELRDVVKKADYDKFKRDKGSILDTFDHHELENLLDVGTAPELAAWVIERLEVQS